MHGGGPPVTAGKPLDHVYKEEAVELVEAGCCNLARHIRNARGFGVPVVIAINAFTTDTPAELDAVRRAALQAGRCRHAARVLRKDMEFPCAPLCKQTDTY